MTNEEAAAAARALVAEYFVKEPEKVQLWFDAPNPLVGNVAPQWLIDVGRASVLLKVVQEALAENEPPP